MQKKKEETECNDETAPNADDLIERQRLCRRWAGRGDRRASDEDDVRSS